MAWRTLFGVFLVCIALGTWKQDDFKHITNIHPLVEREPTQHSVEDADPIVFSRDGFTYQLEPVATYDLSALVVHRLLYDRWFSLSRTDKLFTTDLCVVWGDNVTSGAYREQSFHVKQDFRFCIYRSNGTVRVQGDSFANTHILTTDPDVEDVIRTIRPGDQVRLQGLLVHVHGTRTDDAYTDYEPNEALWRTSTTRTDTGAGACEVLYVKSVEILREGNPLYRLLYTIGLSGLLGLVLLSFVRAIVRPLV